MKKILFVIVLFFLSCRNETDFNKHSPTSLGLWNDESDEPLYGIDNLKPVVSGNISTPFDISAVINQVRFAFREKNGFYEGGSTNYSVKVTSDGAFSITPYYFEEDKSVKKKPVKFKTLGVVNPKIFTNEKASLNIKYKQIVEELKNTENGLEQSWFFAQKPDSDKDIIIKIAVEGADYIGKTITGLHFANKGDKLGLRYGTAKWIDAKGHETTIIPEWENGYISITVPISVIESSTYPAVLDPVIGPEFGIDEPVYSDANFESFTPDVAFDGTDYMVVWSDTRKPQKAIYGARVSTSGDIIDPAGFLISSNQYCDLQKPTISFDGNNYLVIWNTIYKTTVALNGTRITKNCKILDETPIHIAGVSYSEKHPISFDGVNYLVVYITERNLKTIVAGKRITQEGVVLDKNGFIISRSMENSGAASVAFDGVNHFVVWTDKRSGRWDLYGNYISISGELIETEDLLIETHENFFPFYSTSLLFDGNNYLVSWNGSKDGMGMGIYFKRITKNGIILDTDAIEVTSDTLHFTTIFSGGNYVFLWLYNDYNVFSINGAIVSSSGIKIKEFNVISKSNEGITSYKPSVSTDGQNIIIVLSEKQNNIEKIFGYIISSNGDVFKNQFLISRGANYQYSPAIAFDGTNYLVVWEDIRNGKQSDIYGSLVTSDGIVVNTEGIPVSIAENDQRSPELSFDGSNYFVVWLDYRNEDSKKIYGARITKTGTLLDPDGIVISKDKSSSKASIAFDGTNYFVVWNSTIIIPDFGYNVNVLSGSRVSTDGKVLDSEGIILGADIYYSNPPAISFDGTNYFVLYIKNDFINNSTNLYGTIFSQEGEHIKTVPIFNEIGKQKNPSVVFDENDYFVVWYDYRTFDKKFIYGTKVTTEGNVINPDGIKFLELKDDANNMDVGFNGNNYILIFQDKNYISLSDSLIYGATISKNDYSLSDRFLISEKSITAQEPSVVALNNGKAMIVYSHFYDRPEFNSYRVAGRLFYDGILGNSCEENNECDPNYCVDGVCCLFSSCDDNNPCTIDSCASSGDGTCTNTPGNAGTVCRPLAGGCDIQAEYCDGISSDCPEDSLIEADTVCNTATRPCELDTKCTGDSPLCPANPFKDQSFKCAEATELCENDSYCTGNSYECPGTTAKDNTVECRESAGVCDTAEFCNGTDKVCPSDAKLTTVCRGKNGDCDVAEYCDGISFDCPEDSLIEADTVCNTATRPCELDAKCTGESSSCPQKTLKNTSFICNDKKGDCDVAEYCDGINSECPENKYEPDYMECQGDGYDWMLYQCINGTCESIEELNGGCSNFKEIKTFPFEDTSEITGRPNHIKNYGAGCEEMESSGSDVIYKITVRSEKFYTVTVKSDFDAAIAIIRTCSDNEECIYVKDKMIDGDETIIFETDADDTFFIVIESVSGNGSYILTVIEKDFEIQNDSDTDHITDSDNQDDDISDSDSLEIDDNQSDADFQEIDEDSSAVDNEIIKSDTEKNDNDHTDKDKTDIDSYDDFDYKTGKDNSFGCGCTIIF